MRGNKTSLETKHNKTEDCDEKMSKQKSRSAKCIIHTPTNRCMLTHTNLVSYHNTLKKCFPQYFLLGTNTVSSEMFFFCFISGYVAMTWKEQKHK